MDACAQCGRAAVDTERCPACGMLPADRIRQDKVNHYANVMVKRDKGDDS